MKYTDPIEFRDAYMSLLIAQQYEQAEQLSGNSRETVGDIGYDRLLSMLMSDVRAVVLRIVEHEREENGKEPNDVFLTLLSAFFVGDPEAMDSAEVAEEARRATNTVEAIAVPILERIAAKQSRRDAKTV